VFKQFYLFSKLQKLFIKRYLSNVPQKRSQGKAPQLVLQQLLIKRATEMQGEAPQRVLQQFLIKPTTERVAGRSPAKGFYIITCGRFESKLL